MIVSFCTFSLLPYEMRWNVILVLLFFCSVIAIAIFIERLAAFRKAEIDKIRFLSSLRNCLREGEMVQAILQCENESGAIARVIRAGLLRHEQPRDLIESAMEIAGKQEIAGLEKNARLLSLIAHLCPLLGLLGTVLGFIQAFAEMRMSGLVDISATRLGEAMEYALVTTAAGLSIAIPSTLAYNYLVSRMEQFVLELQSTGAEVVELLQRRL